MKVVLTLREVLTAAVADIEAREVEPNVDIDLALSEIEDISPAIRRWRHDLCAGGYRSSVVQSYGVCEDGENVSSARHVMTISCNKTIFDRFSPGFKWSVDIPILDTEVVDGKYKVSIIESPAVDCSLVELANWVDCNAFEHARNLALHLKQLGDLLEDYTPDEIRSLRESWHLLNGSLGVFGKDYEFWLEDYCYHDRVASKISAMELDLKKLHNIRT